MKKLNIIFLSLLVLICSTAAISAADLNQDDNKNLQTDYDTSLHVNVNDIKAGETAVINVTTADFISMGVKGIVLGEGSVFYSKLIFVWIDHGNGQCTLDDLGPGDYTVLVYDQGNRANDATTRFHVSG